MTNPELSIPVRMDGLSLPVADVQVSVAFHSCTVAQEGVEVDMSGVVFRQRFPTLGAGRSSRTDQNGEDACWC